MITWSVAIALMVVAFIAGYATALRRSRNTVVWSKPVEPIATPDVEELISSGHKIEAIKLYRQLHGTDLKDSKDAVEALERRLIRP